MRVRFFIILITVLSTQKVIAQEDIIENPRPKLWQPPDTSILVNKLIRKWELGEKNNDTLTYFSGDAIIKRPWNEAAYIVFLPYEQFEDGFQAGCGNDDRIHNTKGQWNFDPSTMGLETTIPINSEGKKYKLIYLSTTKMVICKKQ